LISAAEQHGVNISEENSEAHTSGGTTLKPVHGKQHQPHKNIVSVSHQDFQVKEHVAQRLGTENEPLVEENLWILKVETEAEETVDQISAEGDEEPLIPGQLPFTESPPSFTSAAGQDQEIEKGQCDGIATTVISQHVDVANRIRPEEALIAERELERNEAEAKVQRLNQEIRDRKLKVEIWKELLG